MSSDGKGLSSGEIEIAVRTRDAKSSERVAAAAEASNPVNPLSGDIVSTSVGESLRAAGGRVDLGEGRGSSGARELEDEETTGGRGVAQRCCSMC